MREIVYPEYHLTIPNLVKNILKTDQNRRHSLLFRNKVAGQTADVNGKMYGAPAPPLLSAVCPALL